MRHTTIRDLAQLSESEITMHRLYVVKDGADVLYDLEKYADRVRRVKAAIETARTRRAGAT